MPSVSIVLTAQDQISDTLSKVGDSMGKVSDASTKTGDAFNKAALEAIKLMEAETKLAISQERLEQAQLKTEEAQRKAAQSAESVSSKFEEMGGHSKAAEEGAGGLAEKLMGPLEQGFEIAIEKIGEFIAESVKLAAEFDQALTNLAAVSGVTDTTSQKFQDLGNAALEIGTKTQYSSDVAIKGMSALRDTGQDLTNVIGEALPVAYLAEINGSNDMASAAKVLGGALNTFHQDADQAQHDVDVMGKAQQIAGLSANDYGNALKNAGAITNQVGQTNEEMTAIIMAQTKAHISAAQAGINHRNMLMTFIKPTKSASDELHALGVSIYDANGKMRDEMDILQDLQNATRGMTDQAKNSALAHIFNKNAMQEFNIVTGQGISTVRGWEDELKNADGTTEEMAATMRQSLEMSLKNLMGSFAELQVTIGKTFLPGLTVVVKGITDMVNEVVEKVTPIAKELTPKITAAFQEMWNFIHPIIQGLIDGFSNAYEVIKPHLDELFKTFDEGKGPLGDAGELIGTLASDIIPGFVTAMLPFIDTGIAGVKMLESLASAAKSIIDPIKGAAEALGIIPKHVDDIQHSSADIARTMDDYGKTVKETQEKIKELTAAHAEAKQKVDELATSGKASASEINAVKEHELDLTKQLGEMTAAHKDAVDGVQKGYKALEDQLKAVKDQLKEMDKARKEGHDFDAKAYGELKNKEAELTATVKKEKAEQAKAGKDAAKVTLDATTESDDAQASSGEELTKKQKAALEKIQEAQVTASEKTADLADKTKQKLLDIDAKKNQDILSANDKLSQDLEKFEEDKVKSAQSTADKIAGINNSLLDKELSFADQRKSAEEKANEEIVKIQDALKNSVFKNADEKKRAEQKAADEIKLINLKLADDKAHIDRQDSAEQQKAAREKVLANQKAQQDIAGIDAKEAQSKQKTQTDIEKVQAKAKQDAEKAAADQKVAQEKIQQDLDKTVAKNQEAAGNITGSQKQVSDGANTSADGVDQANQKMAGSTADSAAKIGDSHQKITQSAVAMSDAVGKAMIDAVGKMSSAVQTGLQKLDSDFNQGFQKIVDTTNANGQKIVAAVDKTTEAIKQSAQTIVSGLGSIIQRGDDAIVSTLQKNEQRLEDSLTRMLEKMVQAKQKADDLGKGMGDGSGDNSGGGANGSSGGANNSLGGAPDWRVGLGPAGGSGDGNGGAAIASVDGGKGKGNNAPPWASMLNGYEFGIGGPFGQSDGHGNNLGFGGGYSPNAGFGKGGTHTTNVYMDGRQIAIYMLDLSTESLKQHIGGGGYVR